MATPISPEAAKSNPPKRKRRWFQFSLRTMLAIVTLFCLGCGWFAYRLALLRDEFWAEQAIVAVIEQRGGTVSYEDVGPFWACEFAGTAKLTISMRVTHVTFAAPHIHSAVDTSTVPTIELLRRLPRLYVVGFSYAHFSDPPELGGTSPDEVKKELKVAISQEAD